MKNNHPRFKFYMNNAPEMEIIKNILEPAVEHVREKLRKKYDVISSTSKYYRYTGLCDESVKLFTEHIQNTVIDDDMKIEPIHGEQKHSPRILSENWVYEHTWCKIYISGYTFYVDPTSSQFSKLHRDIPNWYVSTTAPKWYYPDSKNPVFMRSGFTRKINEKIHLKYKWSNNYGDFTSDIGIIEAFQYLVWGKISDFIHNNFIDESRKERNHIW